MVNRFRQNLSTYVREAQLAVWQKSQISNFKLQISIGLNVITDKRSRLFIILGGFFITNALLAEFVGVKIFSVEKLLGFQPADMTILGVDGLSFNLTAGVLLWPVVFVMTDVVNEYYGMRGVRLLSFLSVGLIIYAFIMVYMAIGTPPADFWISVNKEMGVSNMNTAFRAIFGQGLWIIVGSLIAFLIGQLIDVFVFQKVKRWTGDRFVWLRATGSTLVSQFLDSFVVLYIAFYIGGGWEMKTVLAIGVVNYVYKCSMAVILTPLIYLFHFLIDTYLGRQTAQELKQQALLKNQV